MRTERCDDACCPMHLPGTEHSHVVFRPDPDIPLWPAIVAAAFAMALVAGAWWWTW